MDQSKRFTQTVTVDAIQWTGDNDDSVQAFLHNGQPHAAAGWVKGDYVEIGVVDQWNKPSLQIAKVGDWILRKSHDSYCVMHDEEFNNTYQETDS